MRWGAEFGLVVEQKPLPANKTRLFNSAFFSVITHTAMPTAKYETTFF
jgi:hypothetical protein